LKVRYDAVLLGKGWEGDDGTPKSLETHARLATSRCVASSISNERQ
jgi:hypothetical protein